VSYVLARLHESGGVISAQTAAVPITLTQFCVGLSWRHYRDSGTGLSRATIINALRESIDVGVLSRPAQEPGIPNSRTATYTINWQTAFAI
jgi:hypothetical protein